MKKQHNAAGPTPEIVEELTRAVQALTDQVRMLRQAVDEIEDELGWAIRNRIIDRPARTEITSLLVDPLADSFCERVNEVRTIPPEANVKRQSSLW